MDSLLTHKTIYQLLKSLLLILKNILNSELKSNYLIIHRYEYIYILHLHLVNYIIEAKILHNITQIVF